MSNPVAKNNFKGNMMLWKLNMQHELVNYSILYTFQSLMLSSTHNLGF